MSTEPTNDSSSIFGAASRRSPREWAKAAKNARVQTNALPIIDREAQEKKSAASPRGRVSPLSPIEPPSDTEEDVFEGDGYISDEVDLDDEAVTKTGNLQAGSDEIRRVHSIVHQELEQRVASQDRPPTRRVYPLDWQAGREGQALEEEMVAQMSHWLHRGSEALPYALDANSNAVQFGERERSSALFRAPEDYDSGDEADEADIDEMDGADDAIEQRIDSWMENCSLEDSAEAAQLVVEEAAPGQYPDNIDEV